MENGQQWIHTNYEYETAERTSLRQTGLEATTSMLFALLTLSASSGVNTSCGVPGTVSAFDALPGLADAAVEAEDDVVSMPAKLAASLSILLM